MASLRVIRQRLKSIQNSKQIMRAMQLVSGSKLKRSQTRLMEARDVLAFLDGLLLRVLSVTPGLEHPLCQSSEGPEELLVLFTSDAGLCGSYNTNLIQLAEAYFKRDGHSRAQVIYVGKKGYRYFTKRGYKATDAYIDLAGHPNVSQAESIGRTIMERFLKGEVACVKLLYSRFLSASVYRPTLETFLPIRLDALTAESEDSGNEAGIAEYIFEPSAERVFEDLMPRWTLAKFQCLMLEAFTSEHSARMIAMKNATDNAQTLLDELTLQRNRMRQAAITKELSEIVGTAEALK